MRSNRRTRRGPNPYFHGLDLALGLRGPTVILLKEISERPFKKKYILPAKSFDDPFLVVGRQSRTLPPEYAMMDTNDVKSI